ncbi:MAG: acetyl-CoA carboxylase, carboxyltransferase subunit beta [candidate division NC10 bacterium]|nr:acetyl-CoA carboxylase, carboxyltransferase subunit beta [candidate division NC10 bacterium]
MIWFKKKEETASVKESRLKVPDGLWIKCESCKEIIYKQEVERNLKVCPKCNYHFRIGAKERLALLVDEGSFKEYDARLQAMDPLNFKDSKPYQERIKEAKKATGMNEAVISGLAKIGGFPVSLCILEFSFLGGSMASVVGEKVTRAIERAIQEGCPLIIISCSGGARMQEGVLSLMQMAKTSASLARLSKAGQVFISILTDPTTGVVTASFAMLGDIIMAEPKALIGFAGPRVIEQTIRQELPPGFQRAEFLLEHGMIDMIVDRKSMRDALIKLLDFFSPSPAKAS